MDSNEPSGLNADDLLRDLAWLRRLAQSLTQDTDAADDIVQQTLIAATTQPAPAGAVRSWLRGIARNLHRAQLRAEARRDAREPLSIEHTEVLPPDQLLERAEAQSALSRFVVGLSEPYRTTVLLHYFQGLTSTEIGERMSVPPATVRWRLAEALKELRNQLDQWSDGKRRRWAVLLGLPERTAPSRAAPLLKGVIMAKGTTKAAVLAALLLALVSGGWLLWSHPTHRTTVAGKPGSHRPRLGSLGSSSTMPALPSAKVLEGTTGTERVVDGTVRSSMDGSGVKAATLTFLCEGVASTVSSDGTGHFRLTLSEAVRCELTTVSARGFASYSSEMGRSERVFDVRTAAHLVGVEVFLEPERRFVGKVVDPQDQPVVGARVTYVLSDGSPSSVPIGTHWTTDEHGAFEFDGTPRMMLEATHPQFGPGRMITGGASGYKRQVLIKLSDPSSAAATNQTIDGLVVGSDGNGIPDTLLTAIYALPYGAKAYGPAPQQVLSGPSGSFHFAGLEAGRWTLRTEGEELATARTVVDAGARGVRIQLTTGGSITGVVRDVGGRPIPGFTIVAQKRLGALERGEDGASQSFYSASGRYQIDHLPSGQYSVAGGAAGFASSKEVVVDVRDGIVSSADLALTSGGTIRGQVLEVGTAKPLAGIWVDVSATVDLPFATSVLTDQTGAFVLSGATAGMRTVSAISEDHMGRTVGPLQVAEGQTVGPITIELRPLKLDEEPGFQMVGIGISIGPKGDNILLNGIVPGGGAADAGLAVGDLLTSVDGQDVASLGFLQASAMIRGAEGTVVRLGVKRGNAPIAIVEVKRKLMER